jgi:intergrase/recombinase
MLKHFRYPLIFLRRTKKAFVSVVNQNLLNMAYHKKESLTYDIIRLTFLRNNQKFYISYCRKVFATFMRNEGIEPEIIDLLQGRIPNSIFVRHYYIPDSSEFDTIKEKLAKLHCLINE